MIGGFIVSRDGEAMIAKAIYSLRRVCARVTVLVDNRTTDRTALIAQTCGAAVVHVALPTGSYEAGLNIAAHALNGFDWLLYLHDDEELEDAAIAHITRAQGNPSRCLKFARKHLYPDEQHYVVTAPLYPDWQLRFVPRQLWLDNGGWEERVHASPAWAFDYAQGDILHYKFICRTFEQRTERMKGWVAEWSEADSDHYRAFSIIEGRDVRVKPLRSAIEVVV